MHSVVSIALRRLLLPIKTLFRLRFVPVGLWPVRYHVLLALLAVVLTFGAFALVIRQAQVQLQVLSAQNVQAQQSLADAKRAVPAVAAPDYVQSLPSANRTDDVVRDIGRFAQSAGVQVNTLVIDATAATETQLGQVRFAVSANSPYKATKTWLSELLGRYSSLGVSALSLQAPSSDPSRQEVRVNLVLYVKD